MIPHRGKLDAAVVSNIDATDAAWQAERERILDRSRKSVEHLYGPGGPDVSGVGKGIRDVDPVEGVSLLPPALEGAAPASLDEALAHLDEQAVRGGSKANIIPATHAGSSSGSSSSSKKHVITIVVVSAVSVALLVAIIVAARRAKRKREEYYDDDD